MESKEDILRDRPTLNVYWGALIFYMARLGKICMYQKWFPMIGRDTFSITLAGGISLAAGSHTVSTNQRSHNLVLP